MSSAIRAKSAAWPRRKAVGQAGARRSIPRETRTHWRFSVMNRSKIANLGSQTGSQRHPIPGYTIRQRIGIATGQGHISRRKPTLKYVSKITRNEQVVGSIPTGGSAVTSGNA
jgi:hypothetical protein